MRSLFVSMIALSMAVTPALAGSKANSNSTSVSVAQSNSASTSSGNKTTFNDRLQAPGMGGFGGGGCPEGLMLSVPGGGIGFQVQCREYKQMMKYGVVNGAFGRDGTRRWLCESDKQLYTLPQCRAYRMENSGIKRNR